MNDEGLRIRRLKKLNRESKARILAQNIGRTFGEDTVRDLCKVFSEIDWMREPCEPWRPGPFKNSFFKWEKPIPLED